MPRVGGTCNQATRAPSGPAAVTAAIVGRLPLSGILAMRRSIACPLALLALVAAPLGAAHSQSGAPHAWLFGEWTGGLFPVPEGLTTQACLGEPTVIFTRDAVMRAALTDVTYTQRVIVTARTSPGQTDIQFTPAVDSLAATSNGLLGLDAPKAAAGFGCDSDDVLHVRRVNDNEIVFPGCREFPNPLVRCPAR